MLLFAPFSDFNAPIFFFFLPFSHWKDLVCFVLSTRITQISYQTIWWQELQNGKSIVWSLKQRVGGKFFLLMLLFPIMLVFLVCKISLLALSFSHPSKYCELYNHSEKNFKCENVVKIDIGFVEIRSRLIGADIFPILNSPPKQAQGIALPCVANDREVASMQWNILPFFAICNCRSYLALLGLFEHMFSFF